jgi:hypothetical protein
MTYLAQCTIQKSWTNLHPRGADAKVASLRLGCCWAD